MTWEGFELLEDFVGQRVTEFALISGERRVLLEQLASDLQNDLSVNSAASVIFICTHNSRRSHMSHLWAQMASIYYRVSGISCFSGGTESTAFYSSAIKALVKAGMKIEQQDKSQNPHYHVQLPGQAVTIDAFSKRYEDPPNPRESFFAVMTCSNADEACPIVYGALSRHVIRYDDPKEYDGTREESLRYEERSSQIAREMLYLFSRLQ
jgi:arsenate reductase